MPRVEHSTQNAMRFAGVVVASFFLAACADKGFQWPWSKKPETTTQVPPAPPPQPATTSDIRKIQAGLAKLGFKPGPIDGKYGRKTKRAILKYQRAHGLPEDGETTVALRAHIESTLAARPRRTNSGNTASTGESQRQTESEPRLPLAAYVQGSEYVYQNGEVDRVESVKPDEIKWRRSDSEYLIGAPNFLLPAKYWETSEMRGKAILTGGDKNLWPSQENETKSFQVVKTVIDRADENKMTRTEERWSCANEGRRRLTVPAGTFETVRLVCTRDEEGGNTSARRVWDYAPAIRHYVRLDEFTRDEPNARRRELVAIRPGASNWPPVARAALERRLVAALGETAVGNAVEWKSSGIPTEVKVELTSEYIDSMGRQCRRYRQIWSQGSRERHYPGVACRDKSGKWRLPVAERAMPGALAVASLPIR